MKNTKSVGKLIIYACALIWLASTLAPLLFTLLSSFKTNEEMHRSALALPAVWNFGNYATANRLGHSFRSISNSLMVAIATTILEVIIAMMASYVISRKEKVFFARKIYLLFVVAVMVPIHSTLIPISSFAMSIGMKNNMIFLTLVYVCFNLAQGIFLFTAFLDGISKEIDEAAIIDGCSDFNLLVRILLPICKPVIATEAIFAFIYAYGELIFSLTLISDSSKYTVPRAMLSFWGEFEAQIGPQYAFIILSSIPTVMIYILFHKQIQKGIMTGSVKG